MKRIYTRRNGRQLVGCPQMALLVDHLHMRELNLAARLILLIPITKMEPICFIHVIKNG